MREINRFPRGSICSPWSTRPPAVAAFIPQARLPARRSTRAKARASAVPCSTATCTGRFFRDGSRSAAGGTASSTWAACSSATADVRHRAARLGGIRANRLTLPRVRSRGSHPVRWLARRPGRIAAGRPATWTGRFEASRRFASPPRRARRTRLRGVSSVVLYAHTRGPVRGKPGRGSAAHDCEETFMPQRPMTRRGFLRSTGARASTRTAGTGVE